MASILVIDDDEHVRGFLRILLRSAGHLVTEVTRCEEVRTCGQGDFDAVLCDLVMPGKGGLETIADIHRDFPGLPVIAMTGGWGGNTRDLLLLARCLGATETLSKPFGTAAVLGAVGRVLGRPAAPGTATERHHALTSSTGHGEKTLIL
jgi:DNA-binding NtrC family response regulator